MERIDSGLQSRARRAYELGRARVALGLAPVALAAVAIALACGRPTGACLALGGALFALVAGLSFAGGSEGRAVWPGLLAGTAPLALPLIVKTAGHACFGDSCMQLCLPACVFGGLVAGVVVGVLARREEGRGVRFAFAALGVAALTGCLGCTIGGTLGVLAMLGGLAAGGTPVLALARARR